MPPCCCHCPHCPPPKSPPPSPSAFATTRKFGGERGAGGQRRQFCEGRSCCRDHHSYELSLSLKPPSTALLPALPAATIMENNEGDNDEQALDSPPMTRASFLSTTVKDIMGKVVAEKSSINYSYQNSAFAFFCFENEQELQSLLLEPWFIERLREPFSTTTARKKYVQDCVLSMSPEDDNCPFCLSNLTFAHFSNFLST